MGREGGRRKAQEILSIKSEWIQDVFCFFDGNKSLRIILSIIVMIIDLSELNINDYETARRKTNSMK